MKQLPPTLREDHRYLRFRIHSRNGVEFGDVVAEFWGAILDYLGSKGASKASPWVIKNQWDQDEQVGVLKVERSSEKDVRAALSLIKDFEGEKSVVETVRTSGTLKSL